MSSAAPVHPPIPAPAGDALRWRQADHDVFVATLHEEFAGFISVSSAGHALHGAHAQPIGVYRTRRDAQEALRAHTLRQVAVSPRGAVASRGGRRRPRSRVRG
ncbi:hypothetical protein [Microbacterium rhizophilus]|uniref:hypothetical protein n=1 Tax=Microbacterium rhizophilus TaxID=3138934 RepID=UPI0031EE478C